MDGAATPGTFFVVWYCIYHTAPPAPPNDGRKIHFFQINQNSEHSVHNNLGLTFRHLQYGTLSGRLDDVICMGMVLELLDNVGVHLIRKSDSST